MNFDDKLLYGFWLIIQREFKGLSDPAITKHLPFLFAYLYKLESHFSFQRLNNTHIFLMFTFKHLDLCSPPRLVFFLFLV